MYEATVEEVKTQIKPEMSVSEFLASDFCADKEGEVYRNFDWFTSCAYDTRNPDVSLPEWRKSTSLSELFEPGFDGDYFVIGAYYPKSSDIDGFRDAIGDEYASDKAAYNTMQERLAEQTMDMQSEMMAFELGAHVVPTTGAGWSVSDDSDFDGSGRVVCVGDVRDKSHEDVDAGADIEADVNIDASDEIPF